MADFKTTAYQADVLKKEVDNTEQTASIYYNVPDQFVEYENKSYNPIDFFTNSGEFNMNLINKSYRLEQLKRMEFYRKLERDRLDTLHKLNPKIEYPLNLSIGQNLINLQNTFFGIYSDLITEPININIITKNNRMFYLGMFLIIIFIVYAIISKIQIA